MAFTAHAWAFTYDVENDSHAGRDIDNTSNADTSRDSTRDGGAATLRIRFDFDAAVTFGNHRDDDRPAARSARNVRDAIPFRLR